MGLSGQLAGPCARNGREPPPGEPLDPNQGDAPTPGRSTGDGVAGSVRRTRTEEACGRPIESESHMRSRLLSIVLVLGVAGAAQMAPSPVPHDYAITPVARDQVQITDDFWAPKIEVNRTVSLQHVFDRSEEHGGMAPPQLIEAAAYMLTDRSDPV